MEGKELQKALQYLPTQGLPALVNWLKDLQKEVHHPPQETELIITCGSQDGLCKVLEMLLHPSGGTPVSTDLGRLIYNFQSLEILITFNNFKYRIFSKIKIHGLPKITKIANFDLLELSNLILRKI